MAMSTPSLTLYVSGLETKTKKPELRQQLYSLFNPYGRVVDVIAKKHDGGRGQAFVVFDEQAAATSAMRALSGELFYNKELRITYSRSPSAITLSRTNPEASREAALVRAAKMTVSNAAGEYEQLEKERAAEEERLAGGSGGDATAETSAAGLGGAKRELEGGSDGPASKRTKQVGEDVEEVEMDMDEDDEDEAAGRKLICSNLPPECNEQIMSALYSQYPGFVSASPLPSSRSPPASHPPQNANARSFVITFSSSGDAQGALGETKGYLMQPGWEMGVSAE